MVRKTYRRCAETLIRGGEQINLKEQANPPQREYGELKHKPYRNLTNGRNVVRMPHEFAIGFRFGHSQLRPFYILNEQTVENPVILFKDARHSQKIKLSVPHPYDTISGADDLRGSRPLSPDHVIDWDYFYPAAATDVTQSLKIDHKVTERVFNLPESAIPDDIKFIGNLAHRNLIRSSQIGIVAGEELAEFYGYQDAGNTNLTPDDILGKAAGQPDVENLFKINPESVFKTPLWYYLLKEAEVQSGGGQLGKVGSRLVGEVLAGALYYSNNHPFDNNWISVLHTPDNPQFQRNAESKDFGNITIADHFTLREIIEFVQIANP